MAHSRDGEVIVSNNSGLAVFDLIRSFRHDRAAVLCAFDLLELNGEDLRRQPIEQRKARLARLLPKSLQGMARKMPRYGLPESKWANPFKPRHHTREEYER